MARSSWLFRFRQKTQKGVAALCLACFLPLALIAAGSAPVLCIEADGCLQIEPAHPIALHQETGALYNPVSMARLGDSHDQGHFDIPLWVDSQGLKSPSVNHPVLLAFKSSLSYGDSWTTLLLSSTSDREAPADLALADLRSIVLRN